MLPPIRVENVSSPLIPASKWTTKKTAEISIRGTKHFFEQARELFASRNVAPTARRRWTKGGRESSIVKIRPRENHRRCKIAKARSRRPIAWLEQESGDPAGMNDLCRYATHPLGFAYRYVRLRPGSHLLILIAVLAAVACSV